jgi:phosphoribosyl-ATP pyrophosphohydrolase/phosphoribosyl-AMP cyclohydrolase
MRILTPDKIATLTFDDKGLIPAIVQDFTTQRVLMLGYMNHEAILRTFDSKQVTFFSRSKDRIWTKGETSGNYLKLNTILFDCDNDALLILANPVGAVCHTGTDTCFDQSNDQDPLLFLRELRAVIAGRQSTAHLEEQSYTASLFRKGTPKIAQKVGEEAVEVVIEALRNDKERFIEESADLIFHLMVLCAQMDTSFEDISRVLAIRNQRSRD